MKIVAPKSHEIDKKELGLINIKDSIYLKLNNLKKLYHRDL